MKAASPLSQATIYSSCFSQALPGIVALEMNMCERFQVKSKEKLWWVQEKERLAGPSMKLHCEKSLRNRNPKPVRSELKASDILLSSVYGIYFILLTTYLFSIGRGSIECYLRAWTLMLYLLGSDPRFDLLLLYFYCISWILHRGNAMFSSSWEHCQILFPYVFLCKWGHIASPH